MIEKNSFSNEMYFRGKACGLGFFSILMLIFSMIESNYYLLALSIPLTFFYTLDRKVRYLLLSSSTFRYVTALVLILSFIPNQLEDAGLRT